MITNCCMVNRQSRRLGSDMKPKKTVVVIGYALHVEFISGEDEEVANRVYDRVKQALAELENDDTAVLRVTIGRTMREHFGPVEQRIVSTDTRACEAETGGRGP
jgi:hypothetical protein